MEYRASPSQGVCKYRSGLQDWNTGIAPTKPAGVRRVSPCQKEVKLLLLYSNVLPWLSHFSS